MAKNACDEPVAAGYDTFYLIGSAVFKCMEYHWSTKVRLPIICFSKF
jgi:hypothetical protein